MNAAKNLFVPAREHKDPASLYDDAQSRQTALINMLRLLAGARDLGAPSEDVLSGAFACLEYLAADSERLYAAADRTGA